MITAADLVRRLYRPSVEGMRARLPDLGESLNNAAIDLARDCTAERCDQFAAQDFARHLRRGLVESSQ